MCVRLPSGLCVGTALRLLTPLLCLRGCSCDWTRTLCLRLKALKHVTPPSAEKLEIEEARGAGEEEEGRVKCKEKDGAGCARAWVGSVQGWGGLQG